MTRILLLGAAGRMGRAVQRAARTVPCVEVAAGVDSRQMTMGVWSIEDEVAQDSPARFIEVFVDSLDLE